MSENIEVSGVLIENLFGLGISIHWYGVLIAIGVIVGILLGTRNAKKLNISTDAPIDLALIGIILGVIGARLYYVIFDWNTFKSDLVRILYIWEGGLAIYGAIIGAVIAVLIYSKISKINVVSLMDMGAPCLVLAQAIGRWGNFFNQEAFGTAITNPSLQWFPFGVYITRYDTLPPGGGHVGWYHATFFYESMACLAIFVVLQLMLNRRKWNGQIITWYFFLYGIARFFIEGLRTDSLYIFNTQLRVSQVLSGILAIIMLIILIINWRKSRKEKHSEPNIQEAPEAYEIDDVNNEQIDIEQSISNDN